MAEDLTHFRVSAGLKNIIGNELITDDFVAVFELVKNAYDAHATKVVVRFDNLAKPSDAKLTIIDDGKGMTREDLYEKWLFVAYSAKKHAVEDEGLRKRDYRDLIGVDRPFAGAKGIGRFSCDRLGRYLNIYTRREAGSDSFETLMVDWREFEGDDQRRFEEIDIEHGQTPEAQVPHSIRRGTVLEITGLRSVWTYERLLKLREELQKLITPEGPGTHSSENNASFAIIIEAPEFSERDGKVADPARRVTGRVQNFLFERLSIKTTQLTCHFTESGKTIETQLLDRGHLIYKIIEANTEAPDLRNITFHIFYLNRSAKIAFKKTVGVEPVKYGSVFLYKNGVRVQPYGREGDDGFGIDRRKQQGVRRYLGTRDLAGRIEIRAESSQDNANLFKEASSRNDGLIESSEKAQLFGYFREVVLRRLESYVVDVIQWGNPSKGEDDTTAPQPSEARNEILELVKRLTDSAEIIRFEADPHLLTIVNERQADSAQAILDNFERIAVSHPDDTLANEARRLKREMNAVLHDRAEAAGEARSQRKLRILTEKQLEAERERNKILRGLVTPPEEQRAVLQHWVGIVAGKISTLSLGLITKLQKDEADAELVTRTIQGLATIRFESEKLLTLTGLVVDTGFKMQKQKVTGDLNRFFFECLDHAAQATKLKIETAWRPEDVFTTSFKPVEVAMVVDNIVDNAMKAGAKKVRWQLDAADDRQLRVRVANDGRPLADHMRKLLFEIGATSTHGHGLGLFTCRRIARETGGEMTFVGNDPQLGGAAFAITFGK